MSASLDACTICTMDRLAGARALAASFAAHHPDGRVWVLVVDDVDEQLDPSDQPFAVLRPEDLECPEFERMHVIYDALQLSCALKPWLLRRVLSEAQAAVYLDSDMHVYAPLSELMDAPDAVLVTPHVLAPIARDGRRPNEIDLLIAGIFNAGMIGVRRGAAADRFLSLWAERLGWGCVVDLERGLYNDQRWLDLLVQVTDGVGVLRDPGYNVAYWNLIERPLESHADGWRVSGRPLCCFHFSGFDPREPGMLSSRTDRLALNELPEVAELCAAYAAVLLENGFDRQQAYRYPYDRLACGLELDIHVRTIVREGVENGDLTDDDLTADGGARLLAWLNEPAEPGGAAGVTRYMHRLYLLRPDLCAAFPDLAGSDGSRLVEWWLIYGVAEYGTCEVLLPRAGSPAASHVG
jgi:hypothetical protein